MFSVITNIYNKKTKGPTLMEFFTATGKLKKFFWQPEMFDVSTMGDMAHLIWYSSSCHTCIYMLMRVWQELEYRVDVCRFTPGARIEHL